MGTKLATLTRAPAPTDAPESGRVHGVRPNPVSRYFHDLWRIIVHPTAFFRAMPLHGGWGAPLAFALVTHWVGSALEFVWRQLLGGLFSDLTASVMKVMDDLVEVDHPGRSAQLVQMRDRVSHWFWGAGSVIADPFTTLLWIVFTSFFVYIGARLLVRPRPTPPGLPPLPIQVEPTFESALRIVCYGMSPAILAALPLFGKPISSIFVAVATVIGAREVYQISTPRAIVVALFPKLLFLGVIFGILASLALLALKLFSMAF